MILASGFMNRLPFCSIHPRMALFVSARVELLFQVLAGRLKAKYFLAPINCLSSGLAAIQMRRAGVSMNFIMEDGRVGGVGIRSTINQRNRFSAIRSQTLSSWLICSS